MEVNTGNESANNTAAPAAAPNAGGSANTALTGDLSVTPPSGGGAPAPTGTTPFESPYAEGDWRRTLPQELQSELSLKNMNDVSTLTKAYLSAQKMVGADKVAIPSKHATPEDWKAFYEKVGLPATPDQYEVNVPKESKYIDDNTLKELKPLAHKLGIMPKQLEGILEFYEQSVGKTAGLLEVQKAEKAAAEIKGLESEWGNAYGQNLSLAQKVLKEFGSPELSKYLVDTKLGNDVQIIKLLANAGKKMFGEDAIVGGGKGGNSSVLDPKSARAAMDVIIRNLDHPYHKKDHPGHNAAVQEVEQLSNQAYYSGT